MLDMSEALKRRQIRCLLFDLGDTLWYRDHQDIWDEQESASNRRATKLLHQYVHPSRLPQIEDRSLGQLLRKKFDEQIRSMIHNSPLLEPDAGQAIVAALQTWGIENVQNATGTSIFEALRVRVPRSRPLFPDAHATLSALRQRGFRLGIVTNRLWGGAPFYEDLDTIGLLEYFDRDHIAISGDMGIRKPNPQIFLHTLNALQVSPQETAMIGDSLSADILGAQPLGIYTIWKPKPWLHSRVLQYASSQPAHATVQVRSRVLDTFPGIDTADAQIPLHATTEGTPLTGMYTTDDDYILARENMGRDYVEQFQRGEIRPDHVIGQLAELLEIFPRIHIL